MRLTDIIRDAVRKQCARLTGSLSELDFGCVTARLTAAIKRSAELHARSLGMEPSMKKGTLKWTLCLNVDRGD
jgi:hypothetical protein